jgi:hypothetical protein
MYCEGDLPLIQHYRLPPSRTLDPNSVSPLQLAVEAGHLPVLQWVCLFHQIIPVAAMYRWGIRHLPILNWLREQKVNFPPFLDLVGKALRHRAPVTVLDWCLDLAPTVLEYLPTLELYREAGRGGSLAAVHWLQQHLGALLDHKEEDVLNRVIEGVIDKGQVELLRQLAPEPDMEVVLGIMRDINVTHRVELLELLTPLELNEDERLVQMAVSRGSIPALELFLKRGGALSPGAFCRIDSLAMAEFLLSHNCPWDEEATRITTVHQRADLLNWLVQKGAPWHLECAVEAGMIGLDWFQQVRAMGAPWDEEMQLTLLLEGVPEVVEYLEQ